MKYATQTSMHIRMEDFFLVFDSPISNTYTVERTLIAKKASLPGIQQAHLRLLIFCHLVSQV
jgi:hypothetical protein